MSITGNKLGDELWDMMEEADAVVTTRDSYDAALHELRSALEEVMASPDAPPALRAAFEAFKKCDADMDRLRRR